MVEIKYIDLFCGIGGFRLAAERLFREAGIKSKCVYSCDIDEHARKSYFANFYDMPFGDITKTNTEDIPQHDILFAGFPCQPFSIIGKQNGFEDTRGTLFFEIARILNHWKPKAFILENVKQLVTHHGGKTLERILKCLRKIGYSVDYKVLNALDYGLPQKRERVFIVGFYKDVTFKWPEKQKDRLTLADILEEDVDKKYYVSDRIRKKRRDAHKPLEYPAIWHENKAGNITSYPYSCAIRSNGSYNYLLVNGIRRLTPREMLRLQGFPDIFQVVVSDCQIRKQVGNAVPVNLVYETLKMILKIFYSDNERREIRKYDKKRFASFAYS